jgi:phosphate starvation-inducible PhoH-like protein
LDASQDEAKVMVRDAHEAMALYGRHDEHLKIIEDNLVVRMRPRGTELTILGLPDIVESVEQLLSQLLALIRQGITIGPREVTYAVKLTASGQLDKLSGVFSDVIYTTTRGKQIRPKTLGQKTYLDLIKDNDVVFGIGPAGTGKTYLAMAAAVAALKERRVQRLVLTRPAVEAGERLGFLPGDLQDKVDPYLRPLYDALYDLIGIETFQRHVEKGIIEVAPLAYMRGRTLDDAFIILDEAQNTTHEQMKMFLTRMGFGSKAVITGDLTQVDLPKGTSSGLEEARQILRDVPGIGFVYLSDRDVVRHNLVQKIIKAYEAWGAQEPQT